MKAVILAGGRGSRLMPLTRNIPKPLIPILDKPVISYILDVVKQAGITEVIVTLGYLGKKIERRLSKDDHGLDIYYCYEQNPLGTAGGVKNAEKLLDDDFVVLSGDAFTDIRLKPMIEYHYQKNSLVTIASHYEEQADRFGVIIADKNGLITEFEEKPEKPASHLVNMGIYVLSRRIFDHIPSGFCDFSKDIFPKMIGNIYSYQSDCYWSDIGTLESYYLTNYDVASGMIGSNLLAKS